MNAETRLSDYKGVAVLRGDEMNRRQRLLATFSGKPVDRPPVSFYEIGSFKYDPDDPDEFNVHNDSSWRPLLELAEEKTDIIRLIGAKNNDLVNESQKKILKVEKWRKVTVSMSKIR